MIDHAQSGTDEVTEDQTNLMRRHHDGHPHINRDNPTGASGLASEQSGYDERSKATVIPGRDTSHQRECAR